MHNMISLISRAAPYLYVTYMNVIWVPLVSLPHAATAYYVHPHQSVTADMVCEECQLVRTLWKL